MHKFFRRGVVARVARDAAQEERDVVVQIVKLLPRGMARAEQVAADFPIHEQHKGRLRLPVRVIRGEVVGEEFAILEDGIDRFSEKAGIAAQLADSRAIGWLEFANLESLFFSHGVRDGGSCG